MTMAEAVARIDEMRTQISPARSLKCLTLEHPVLAAAVRSQLQVTQGGCQR